MSSIIQRLVRTSIASKANRNYFQYSVRSFSADPPPNPLDKDYFNKLVNSEKVVVFMKGNPEEPRCGFSNAVVQIMRMHGVKYSSIDVLSDENVRQGIKTYSNWPTIPQVYLNGEFVGGCDILLKLHQSGDLIDELKKCGITSALLKNLPPSELKPPSK